MRDYHSIYASTKFDDEWNAESKNNRETRNRSIDEEHSREEVRLVRHRQKSVRSRRQSFDWRNSRIFWNSRKHWYDAEIIKECIRCIQKINTLVSRKEVDKDFSKHKSWNHEIKLISKKYSTFEFIYALSEKKLSVLRNYLNENLKKEFIKKFESSTEYSIFFASKKNDILRLCVDYRKLNDITIKNRYSLLNINEFQNRLSNVKIFTKIDLKWVYNLIRMKKEKEWKTIFRIRYELYKYTIMSFELTNASTSC